MHNDENKNINSIASNNSQNQKNKSMSYQDIKKELDAIIERLNAKVKSMNDKRNAPYVNASKENQNTRDHTSAQANQASPGSVNQENSYRR